MLWSTEVGTRCFAVARGRAQGHKQHSALSALIYVCVWGHTCHGEDHRTAFRSHFSGFQGSDSGPLVLVASTLLNLLSLLVDLVYTFSALSPRERATGSVS